MNIRKGVCTLLAVITLMGGAFKVQASAAPAYEVPNGSSAVVEVENESGISYGTNPVHSGEATDDGMWSFFEFIGCVILLGSFIFLPGIVNRHGLRHKKTTDEKYDKTNWRQEVDVKDASKSKRYAIKQQDDGTIRVSIRMKDAYWEEKFPNMETAQQFIEAALGITIK